MITIHKLIAQDLNVQTRAAYDSATANRQVIDLKKTSNEILNFFTQHIEKSNRETYRKICIFKSEHGLVYSECSSIFKDLNTDTYLIDASIVMTQSLHSAMLSSSSKSSGTMMYILYEEQGEFFLGIFKMDKNNAIQFNKSSNTFHIHQDILPSLREKLHKTAVVKLKDDLIKDEVHLYVMDKQQSADAGPAFFFITEFLEAEEIMNDRKATSVVVDTLKKSVAEGFIPQISDRIAFNKEVDMTFTKGNMIDFDVEADRLLQAYIEGEAVREEYILKWKDQILSENKDIPLKFKADIPTKKTTYSSGGIKVTFPEPLMNNRVFVSYEDGDTIIKFTGIHLRENKS